MEQKMAQIDKTKMVTDFHSVNDAHIGKKPCLPTTDERGLRQRLLQEEFEEYMVGEKNNDIVEIADALGDMLYIIYGTSVSYGIPIDLIFEEIHRSNMSKLGEDGHPIRRADGKILKGPNYFRPDISKILNACNALGLDPNDVIAENVRKLEARYPGGSFDAHYSENRKDGDI